MNTNTIYRLKSRFENSDLLLSPVRKTDSGYWFCNIICSDHNSVSTPGDTKYVRECEVTKATEQDFSDLRLLYPQGYDN
jgi:hypothetical protein